MTFTEFSRKKTRKFRVITCFGFSILNFETCVLNIDIGERRNDQKLIFVAECRFPYETSEYDESQWRKYEMPIF